jgi:hypothetical protein
MSSDSSAKGKWTLTHGIHRGTIASRDTAGPEEFDTRDAAIKYLNEQKRFYASLGYVLWFAKLVSPDGTEERLAS